jgi:hypothetical protein
MIQADEPGVLGNSSLDRNTNDDTRDKQHACAHGRLLSKSG